jgi:Uma2 family endonuclease
VSDMAASTVLSVRTRPIAVDEYYRMGEVGILRPDERVELLNGRIVEMPPIGPRHNYAVGTLNAKLTIMLGDRAVCFCQGPVRLDRFSEPQPDIAVVRGPRERYLDAHPTPADALVVIEVSDATLTYDRGEKLKAYATAAIPEYWIVDIRHQRIDVYTEPDGDGYRSHAVVSRDQHLASRAFPHDSVDANEILRTD